MLSVGIVGMSYIGSDIGGFTWINPPDLELWVRWLQVGAISPIMAIQGGGTSMAGKPKTHLF
jgi:alpha-glucosidase (family GH31 glycosyl hydrolase)